jgi:hypothetical protein
MPATLIGYLRDLDWRDLADRGRTQGWGSALSWAYREYRRESDVEAISRALEGLSERQLNLIGMSHLGLEGDVDRLMEKIRWDRAYAPPSSCDWRIGVDDRARVIEILPPGYPAPGALDREASAPLPPPWRGSDPGRDGARRGSVRLAA